MVDRFFKSKRASVPIPSMSLKDHFLEENELVFKKYKPITKIGQGAFGSIYSVVRLSDKNVFAMKIEKKSIKQKFLQNEAYNLINLEGFGFPKLVTFGQNKNYNILIETLLGKSLEDIFIEKNVECKLWEVCLIGLQLIDRLEWIHSKDLVYRDIRTSNILIGMDDPNVLYIIDFGLCKKYRSSKTGKHILLKNTGKFTGNYKFASPNVVVGKEASRRDDLISLGYLLIFLLKKKLPWTYDFPDITRVSQETYLEFINLKETNGNGELFVDIPDEMTKFIEYTRSLNFEDEPDYSYLRSLFYQVLSNNDLNPRDLTFSWIKYNRDKFMGLPENNLQKKKNNLYDKLLGNINENKKMCYTETKVMKKNNQEDSKDSSDMNNVAENSNEDNNSDTNDETVNNDKDKNTKSRNKTQLAKSKTTVKETHQKKDAGKIEIKIKHDKIVTNLFEFKDLELDENINEYVNNDNINRHFLFKENLVGNNRKIQENSDDRC